jgi:hypothetical protein
MGTGMATAIAIGFVVIVISIRTAATTDAILPAADSAAAVRARCHPCQFGGPVSGIVVNNDSVAADAPAALPLPPSGATDPTVVATTKTLDCTVTATATVMATAATAATAARGMQRMLRRRPPTPPGRLPPLPGNGILLRLNAATTVGAAAAAESGDRNDVDACD